LWKRFQNRRLSFPNFTLGLNQMQIASADSLPYRKNSFASWKIAGHPAHRQLSGAGGKAYARVVDTLPTNWPATKGSNRRVAWTIWPRSPKAAFLVLGRLAKTAQVLLFTHDAHQN
jgi:hypothetical protein